MLGRFIYLVKENFSPYTPDGRALFIPAIGTVGAFALMMLSLYNQSDSVLLVSSVSGITTGTWTLFSLVNLGWKAHNRELPNSSENH